MIKILVFIRRLPHVSLDDFIRYYEERHAPLANRLLSKYYGYRRMYLVDGLYPPGVDRDFDVVTELTFENEDAYARWQERLSEPEVIAEIRADEANFLDSGYTRMWRIQDHADD